MQKEWVEVRALDHLICTLRAGCLLNAELRQGDDRGVTVETVGMASIFQLPFFEIKSVQEKKIKGEVYEILDVEKLGGNFISYLGTISRDKFF